MHSGNLTHQKGTEVLSNRSKLRNPDSEFYMPTVKIHYQIEQNKKTEPEKVCFVPKSNQSNSSFFFVFKFINFFLFRLKSLVTVFLWDVDAEK